MVRLPRMSDEIIPELVGYPDVLDTAQVAAALRLRDRRASEFLLRTGKLPGFRVGNQWRMRRTALQDVMTGKWEPTNARTD